MCLVVLMSIIHLVPLQPKSEATLLHTLVHFGIAGSYASAGVMEAWLMTQRIEPLLRRHNLLHGYGGWWLRHLCLAASPGWLLVAIAGGIGMALRLQWLEASVSVLEFGIISLYGCYPLSLAPLAHELDHMLTRVNLGKAQQAGVRLLADDAEEPVARGRLSSPGRRHVRAQQPRRSGAREQRRPCDGTRIARRERRSSRETACGSARGIIM